MRRVLCFGVAALSAGAFASDVKGQWEFNDSLNGIGGALTAVGTFAYEDAQIAGQTARVARVTAGTPGNGFSLANPIGANGGGTRTNVYTLVMDVFLPTESTGFQSLLQTGSTHVSSAASNSAMWANDGDWFVNGARGLGISGDYTDTGNALRLGLGAWNRLALVIDTTTTAGSSSTMYRSYVNGVLQNVVQSPSSWGRDGRFSLGGTVGLFLDEDGEQFSSFLVNSVQLRSVALTDAEIATMGGASATGIPEVVPEPGTMLALAAGLAALGARRRRK